MRKFWHLENEELRLFASKVKNNKKRENCRREI